MVYDNWEIFIPERGQEHEHRFYNCAGDTDAGSPHYDCHSYEPGYGGQRLWPREGSRHRLGAVRGVRVLRVRLCGSFAGSRFPGGRPEDFEKFGKETVNKAGGGGEAVLFLQ